MKTLQEFSEKVKDISEMCCCASSPTQQYFLSLACSADCFIVSLTNVQNTWQSKLNLDGLNAHMKSNNQQTDSYINKLRKCVDEAAVTVTEKNDGSLTLVFGTGSDSLFYFLEKLSASESTASTKELLLSFIERQRTSKQKLNEAERELHTLKKQTSPKKEHVIQVGQEKQAKALLTQPGMSIINPASKKRKAAKGVQFD